MLEQTELRATETLLERGVEVKISAPLFIRWVKRSITLKIQMPTLGNKLRINRRYLAMKIHPEQLVETTVHEADELMLKHGNTICRIVAIGMLRGYLMPILFSWPLSKFLKWNTNSKQLLTLAQILILFSGTSDFMSTIRLTRELKITAPNLSQANQGS